MASATLALHKPLVALPPAERSQAESPLPTSSSSAHYVKREQLPAASRYRPVGVGRASFSGGGVGGGGGSGATRSDGEEGSASGTDVESGSASLSAGQLGAGSRAGLASGSAELGAAGSRTGSRSPGLLAGGGGEGSRPASSSSLERAGECPIRLFRSGSEPDLSLLLMVRDADHLSLDEESAASEGEGEQARADDCRDWRATRKALERMKLSKLYALPHERVLRFAEMGVLFFWLSFTVSIQGAFLKRDKWFYYYYFIKLLH